MRHFILNALKVLNILAKEVQVLKIYKPHKHITIRIQLLLGIYLLNELCMLEINVPVSF